MKNLANMTMAVFAAAFLASSPVIAADATTGAAKTAMETAKTPAKPDMAKPDMVGSMKQKAADAIEKGKTKVDETAKSLQDKLGMSKAKGDAKTVPADGMKSDKMAPADGMKSDTMAPAEAVKDKMAPADGVKSDKMAPADGMKSDKMAPAEGMKDKMAPADSMKSDKAAPAAGTAK